MVPPVVKISIITDSPVFLHSRSLTQREIVSAKRLEIGEKCLGSARREVLREK
jgi:hypothetical protein